jgi:pimeloyl-ACP methyl ester carboxylesterase
MNQTSRVGTLTCANGPQIYYEIYGDGPPLILLHGFTQAGVVWEPFLARLAQQFSVIVVDLRGHGHSTNPSGQLDHLEAAYDVFALLDELKLDKCQAIGMSYGGIALLHMAIHQLERIEAMILVGVTDRMTEQHRQLSRELAPESPSWGDWEMLRQQHVHGDEQIYALLRQFHLWKDLNDEAFFAPMQLAAIRTRTLIVHGDRDGIFPVSIAVGLYQALAHAYLWVIPNGDHLPILNHRVDEFTRTALAFFHHDWAMT